MLIRYVDKFKDYSEFENSVIYSPRTDTTGLKRTIASHWPAADMSIIKFSSAGRVFSLLNYMGTISNNI